MLAFRASWVRSILFVALVTGVALAPTPIASADASTTTYVPPVAPGDGVIVDHFRPPPTPYGAGNRGVDYQTRPGAPVVASAAGVVRFAGAVAGRLVVTVAHADGLRTSDTGLAAIAVTVGQVVVQGQLVGWAGATLHFGVRMPDGTYLDPEALFAGRLGAHLVPGPEEGVGPLPAAGQLPWAAVGARPPFDAGAAAAAFSLVHARFVAGRLAPLRAPP